MMEYLILFFSILLFLGCFFGLIALITFIPNLYHEVRKHF